MNFVQVKNFVTYLRGKMNPNPKFHLLASDMHFSFSVNNQEKVYVVSYHDQEHYDKNKTLIRNDKLGESLKKFMKMSGDEHLIEDIENTL